MTGNTNMQATEMHQVCAQRGMDFVIFTSGMFVLEPNCHEITHFLCVMFSGIFRGVDGTENDFNFQHNEKRNYFNISSSFYCTMDLYSLLSVNFSHILSQMQLLNCRRKSKQTNKKIITSNVIPLWFSYEGNTTRNNFLSLFI